MQWKLERGNFLSEGKYPAIFRRLKSRLHEQSPPSRTNEVDGFLQELCIISTRVGGFCLCRRGFNRRVYWAYFYSLSLRKKQIFSNNINATRKTRNEALNKLQRIDCVKGCTVPSFLTQGINKGCSGFTNA